MRLDYQLDDQDNEKGVCCIVYSVFVIFCNPKTHIQIPLLPMWDG